MTRALATTKHATLASSPRADARADRAVPERQRAYGLRTAPSRDDDGGDDPIEVGEDLRLRHAQHPPAQLAERAVPRAIVPGAPLMGCPIDLDDEPHLGAREVDDGLPDDELTTKRKPGLGPRETAPEPLLRACGIATHALCTFFEELSASGRNESTTVHEDLQEVGADARRAKFPAQLP